jgi:hypothetical protein
MDRPLTTISFKPANGTAVEKGSFKNGTSRIDVSGISSGKYQIEVFTGEEWVYQSIILL